MTSDRGRKRKRHDAPVGPKKKNFPPSCFNGWRSGSRRKRGEDEEVEEALINFHVSFRRSRETEQRHNSLSCVSRAVYALSGYPRREHGA